MTRTPKPTDHDRLYTYVERHFLKSERAAWPTVRQAARGLGWTQARVVAAVEGDPDSRMFMTYYNVAYDVPDGDHFVEST